MFIYVKDNTMATKYTIITNLILALFLTTGLGCVEAVDYKALNQIYQQTLRDLIAKDKAALRRDQRTWMGNRGWTCHTRYIKASGAKWLKIVSRDSNKSRCIIKLSKERVETIKKEIEFRKAKKKYPPYPVVWGYILDKKSSLSKYVGIESLRVMNGDYIFIYRIDEYIDNSDIKYKSAKYYYQEYFSNKNYKFKNQDEYYEYYRRNNLRNRRPIYRNKVFFNDGSSIRVNWTEGGNCFYPLRMFLEKLDKKRKVIKRITLILLLKNKITIPLSIKCGEDDISITTNIITPRTLYLIPLLDDTFLVYSREHNYVVRFDMNFNTKYKKIEKILYLIDQEIVDKYKKQSRKQTEKHNFQYIYDSVTKYILSGKRDIKYGN